MNPVVRIAALIEIWLFAYLLRENIVGIDGHFNELDLHKRIVTLIEKYMDKYHPSESS